MTWREDLLRVLVDGSLIAGASFRGVPFLVQDSGRSGGRRAVTSNFPFRDDPFVEDLGRKEQGFRLEGYVLGNSYMAKREALRAALEDKKGPGELRHPYHGVHRAICTDLEIKETQSNGGIAMFSLVFVRAPVFSLTPTVTANPAGRVAASATTARAAINTEIARRFTVSGMPAFALVSAENALRTANDFMAAKLSGVTTTTQELAELNSHATIVSASAAALVRQPASVLDEFGGAITALTDTIASTPGAVYDALVQSYSVDMGADVAETTATRVTERANQIALTSGLRRVMAIEAARLAPLVPFVSIDDAVAARDLVAGLLEEQAGLATDDSYGALVDLRSEVLRAVPGARPFARVVTVTRRTAIPSLLLAYQLYGSVDKEPDIIARNGIRHPGFVAGDLKVLSNG